MRASSSLLAAGVGDEKSGPGSTSWEADGDDGSGVAEGVGSGSDVELCSVEKVSS